MQVIKSALAVVLVATAMTVGVSKSVGASSNTCSIDPVVPITDIRDPGKNFTFNNDGTVTAQFKVTGDENCKKFAVLAIWDAKNSTGQPLEKQELFSSANNDGKSFSPGVHTLTAKLPNCFWQLDLLEGTDPRGVNGTANYGTLMNPTRHMLDTKLGGKACEDPKPPVTPTPPTQPQVLSVQTVAATTPTTLPSTGPEDMATTFFGVSASAGLAHAIVRRFRIRK